MGGCVGAWMGWSMAGFLFVCLFVCFCLVGGWLTGWPVD